MIKKLLVYTSVLFLFHAAFAQAPRSYTSSEILLQLKKLNTVGSVLYIAAHPDDENTRLITYLANEKCLRTGYLSLTRGDGGQNLIGPEQGIELGVIRTQELLAARRIDGGEQFFTRAYDFGFSKTPDETFKKWNKDSILSDVVWVIRNFKPDIIITRFATDGSGGHGHHTASAILAEEAFDAAADPTRFPEQLEHVSVWKTRRMFYNTVARFRDPNADMSAYIPLDVGGYNPLLGKSYGEIAAESRSMHKSQGFGSAKQRGEFLEHFKPVKGDTAGLKEIFQGMDLSWKRVKGGEKIAATITKITKDYNVEYPEKSLKDLLSISEKLRYFPATEHVDYKYYQIENIIDYSQGFLAEAITSQPYLSLGEWSNVTFNLINRSNSYIIHSIETRPGSLAFNLNQLNDTLINLSPDKPIKIERKIGVTSYDVFGGSPYWLSKSIKSNIFQSSGSFRHYPELSVNGVSSIDISMEKARSRRYLTPQYKWVDPEKGELYRPVVITPPVMINVVNDVLTFSDDQPKEIKVILRAGKDSVSFKLEALMPAQWNIDSGPNFQRPSSVTLGDFFIAKKGEEKTFTFKVKPTNQSTSQLINIYVKVNGQTFTKGIKEIKYDHIPVQTLFPEAEVKLVKLDVKKKLKRIAYIPGAGDEVQACLTQLGYEVTTLTNDKLANENLNQYDAIITGVRAYNTNEKLPAFKQKLMDYVAAGGNLIVQYNTNSWAGPLSSDIGPYPFKITRDRITDEEAKVNFDLPDHPVLNFPNKITEKDFEGWIQERSIYHAGDFSKSNFDAPLSMNDPGEKSNNGALIIAKRGKGNFVYTGLVFFRELPAGVPGAYRLMVNLIELGK